MNFRFTLKHFLTVEDLQFTNNEFESSITGWDQINTGSDIAFTWDNPSAARASGVTSDTTAIGLARTDAGKNWPAGSYTVAITANNLSTGGSSPFVSFLRIFGSETGSALDDQISFSGDSGQWTVGAGESTHTIAFTLTQAYKKLFFKFDKSGVDSGYNVDLIVDSIILSRVNGAFDPYSISEPDGWKEAKLILERDMNFFSLLERYEGGAGGAFIFYGSDERGIDGGYHFIKAIEEVYGPDADIGFLAEYAPNDTDYETIFEGLLDLAESETRPDNKIQVPVVRDDFWRKFITRMDTSVDLNSLVDLDGNSVSALPYITLDLPSQKIRKRYRSTMTESACYAALTTSQYVQIDWDTVELAELEEKYLMLKTVNDSLPESIFIAKEAGLYTFDIKVIFTRPQTTGTGDPGDPFVFTWENLSGWLNVYIKHNNDVGIGFTRTDQSSGSMKWSEFTYNGQFDLKEGDSITIYGDPLNAFTGNLPGSDLILIGTNVEETADCAMPDFFNSSFTVSGLESYLDITADTTYQTTECQGYLIHDAICGVLARMGIGNGRDNPVYSEFLGSTFTTERQYDSDGCGWMYAVAKGLQIRQYTLDEKPFFASFKQLWDGINPILNLGLGYEEINNEQVIRIEQKDHFVTQDISLTITNVRDISYTYDNDLIFKSIKSGYKKWESGDISGIDDPQTRQTRATRFKKIGKELTLESNFIGAGLAIETTRRTTKEKSADYKYDNDIFIFALNENDVSPNRYTPELDENFDSVTGVLNSDSRYNLTLTPLRNFLRWAKYIGGCLQQYATSSYKFVSGEGNYDMVSDYSCASGNQCQAVICDQLSEKQDISLADYNGVFGYYFLPLLYEIRVPLEWDNLNIIRASRKKAIRVSQTESNPQPFKIKELEYDLLKGQVVIRGWPIAYYKIQIIETALDIKYCSVDDALLHEEEGFILQQNSQLILLE